MIIYNHTIELIQVVHLTITQIELFSKNVIYVYYRKQVSLYETKY